MVGNVSITKEHVPNASTGVISSSREWARLASAIQQEGTSPGIQLSATFPGYIGQREFLAKNPREELERYRRMIGNMTKEEWDNIDSLFCNAIDMSLEHGFEHIQVHAAHGYAFSIVLDPKLNPHSCGIDELMHVLDYMSNTCDIGSSLRVSWSTGLEYDGQRQNSLLRHWMPYSRQIALDLSNGYYNLDKRYIYPSSDMGQAPFMHYAVELAKRYDHALFVVAGNVWNPFRYIDRTPSNIEFALGRALIADPQHLCRMKEGKEMVCDDCGLCHYYSKGQRRLNCPKWPKSLVYVTE
jgi:NADPH2 dehydrogenase